jgi:RND family efflux transporter MFP subunit
MRKSVIVIGLVIVVAVAALLFFRGGNESQAAPGATPGMGGGPGMGGPGMGGRGGGGMIGRMPMTVDLVKTTRAPLSEQILVVGNLIGLTTVDVAPKTSGRLESLSVRIGDRVSRGKAIGKLEDREMQQQVRQSEASFEVSRATVRQREADLKFAESSLARSQSLYERDLLAKQALDDAEARQVAAAAGVELARAQFQQASARLEELKINLSNTIIVSPVNGFVGKRNVDPGAWIGPNSPVASVVDVTLVRLVVNLVEKDLRRVAGGMPTVVEVDAYPGETFEGRVARVAPVLDPATRTAQMEVEVPNPDFRLKPGMYARVRITVDEREAALVVPRNALIVNIEGKLGVFTPAAGQKAAFRPVTTGLQGKDLVEVVSGLNEGDPVITTGAAALKDGDAILLPGRTGGSAAPGGRGRGRPGGGRAQGGSPEVRGTGRESGR